MEIEITNRKSYSKEFKLDAIALVVEQGYTKAEVARNLGINANILWRWIKEADADDGHAFRGNGKLTPEQAELRKLCVTFFSSLFASSRAPTSMHRDSASLLISGETLVKISPPSTAITAAPP